VRRAAIALLGAACSGPVSSETVGHVEAAMDPNFSAHGRDTCFTATGIPEMETKAVANGAPTTALDPGINCVETGHAGPGVTYVDVDNPRIWTPLELGSSRLHDGTIIRQAFARDDSSTMFSYGDLLVNASGGDGTPTPKELAGPFASVREPLAPWTPSAGEWHAPDARFLTVVTPGVRVGPTALSLELDMADEHDAFSIEAFPARIALDPEVFLLPVQVVVFFGDSQGGVAPGSSLPANLGVFDLPTQLELWDRLPSMIDPANTAVGPQFPWHAYDGSGTLTASVRHLFGVVPGAENGPEHVQVGRFHPPDDIWAPCGVQFRLVNFMPMAVGPDLLKPTGHTDATGTVESFKTAVTMAQGFQQGAITVVIAPMCSDVGWANPGDTQPPDGVSLVGHDFACVRYDAAPSVLAHELGHLILNETGHPDCYMPTETSNVMCAYGGVGTRVDTATQCPAARKYLDGRMFGRFFHGG